MKAVKEFCGQREKGSNNLGEFSKRKERKKILAPFVCLLVKALVLCPLSFIKLYYLG